MPITPHALEPPRSRASPSPHRRPSRPGQRWRRVPLLVAAAAMADAYAGRT